MVVSREALEWLATLVRAAGDVILGHYDGEVSASLKTDHSPVTEADRAAHRTIVAALPEGIHGAGRFRRRGHPAL